MWDSEYSLNMRSVGLVHGSSKRRKRIRQVKANSRNSELSNWVIVEVKMMEGGAGFEDIKFMIPLKHFSEDGSVGRYLYVFAV